MVSLFVKFVKRHPDAVIPSYAKPGDACMDLSLVEDLTLRPFTPVRVDFGLAFELPVGWEIQVRPRSGNAAKGLVVCSGIGTVDEGYRGTVGATLLWVHNPHESGLWQLKKGARVAQMKFSPTFRAALVQVEELTPSERGEKGFGSSGQ